MNIQQEINTIKNIINDIITVITKSKDTYSASYFISKHPETKYINKLLINKFNIPKERIEMNKTILNEKESNSFEITEDKLISNINKQNEKEFKLYLKLNKEKKE